MLIYCYKLFEAYLGQNQSNFILYFWNENLNIAEWLEYNCTWFFSGKIAKWPLKMIDFEMLWHLWKCAVLLKSIFSSPELELKWPKITTSIQLVRSLILRRRFYVFCSLCHTTCILIPLMGSSYQSKLQLIRPICIGRTRREGSCSFHKIMWNHVSTEIWLDNSFSKTTDRNVKFSTSVWSFKTKMMSLTKMSLAIHIMSGIVQITQTWTSFKLETQAQSYARFLRIFVHTYHLCLIQNALEMSLFALIRNCLCFSNTFKRLELHGYIRSQSHSEVIHTFVKVWHLSTRKFMLFGLSPTAGTKHEHSVEIWKCFLFVVRFYFISLNGTFDVDKGKFSCGEKNL